MNRKESVVNILNVRDFEPLPPYHSRLKEPLRNGFFIMMLSPSAAIRNKKGERGSPCLNPRSNMNSPEALPLTETLAEAEVMQVPIHLSHCPGKSIFLIISNKYTQSTESKAFAKSTLKISKLLLDFFGILNYFVQSYNPIEYESIFKKG